MKEIIYIFIGGGVGSVLRYLAQMGINERMSALHFPWGTFAVNVVGSLFIGLFYSLSERLHLSAEVRLLLTAGLCGGFTTFSAFSYEGLNILKSGCYGTFLLYALFSIGLGVAAVLAGGYIGKQIG